MRILRPPSVAFYTNPLFQPGLDALSWWLEENHYSPHAREAVLAHTAAEGTPTGCAYLEAEDEGPATEAFVGALPAVAYDSAEWGEDGPDNADRSIPAGAVLVPPVLEDLAAALPPISGGSPTPTEADRRDFETWLEQVDADPPAYVPPAADLAEMHAHRDTVEVLWGYE